MDTPRNPAPLTSSDAPTWQDPPEGAPPESENAATLVRSGSPRRAPIDPPSSDPYVGAIIDGRYRVDAVLGRGGMGIVYRATHQTIDKRVAIKILRGELAGDTGLVTRFMDEARAAARIGNPHIVDVTDFGTLPDGATYFVMELVDGQSLAEIMATRGAMPPREITHIARQIAQALHAAHEAGIVHRDLKPDNVMLVRRGADASFVKILDFGIAKVGTRTKRLTVAGDVFGTPHYMSPEQASGAVIDHRSDIYSLGVIMYEMATGRLPFDGENAEILRQHIYTTPAAARSLRADVPQALDEIILKCLEKKPSKRFESMNDLARELDSVPLPFVAEAVPPIEPAYPRSRAVPLAIAAVVFLAIVVGVAFLVVQHFSAPAVVASSARVPAPAEVPSASAMATAAEVVSPAPDLTAVMIVTIPADARIRRGDIDVGDAPKELSFAKGESSTVTISRDGYVPRTLAVDGSKPRVVIELKRLGASMPAIAPATQSAKPPPAPSCKPGEVPAFGKCEHF